MTVLNTLSKEIIPSSTKRGKGVWNFSHATPELESSGEMKLMTKFCLCLHTFSELYLLSYAWEIVFGVTAGIYLRV